MYVGKRMTSNLFVTERFYLVFWPEESSYSVVAEAKIVSLKECSAGKTIQIKEGSKCFSRKVVAVGNKVYIEKQLSEMERNNKEDK
jgi:hypothetical protein